MSGIIESIMNIKSFVVFIRFLRWSNSY